MLVPVLEIPALLLTISSAVVTLVWMYRARRNVDEADHQRRSLGWAVGGWFCPIVNLWFPLQIIADITRVDQPPDKARTYALIRTAWWVCWLATWVSAVQCQEIHGFTATGGAVVSYNLTAYFGGTLASRAFGAAAAFLLAAIVRNISINQTQRAQAQV